MPSINNCSTASPEVGPATRRPCPLRHAAALALLTACAAPLIGCGPRDIDATYGRRKGLASASVNGVSVLAGMFEQRGYKVSSWKRLSPRLNGADVIVWAPDDFAPPTDEQRKFLEDWLWDGAGRTLIYIGRDYDAAITYWEHAAQSAPPEDYAELHRRLAKARTAHDEARTNMPADAANRWFTLKRDAPKRRVTTLSSPAGDWTRTVDPAKTQIVLESRIGIPSEQPASDSQPLPSHEVLLESSGDPLVIRVTDSGWDDGQILVVANGSFLLNAGLVNRENRKLASRLIDECGDRERVVFLESGPGEPEVFDNEPGAAYTTGLEALRTWPMWPIVLQGIALGVIICFALFPIFGRPLTLPRPPDSDFSRHIAALGDLMARTQDRGYALARLDHYQQAVRRESGASHLKPRQTQKNSPFDRSQPTTTTAAPSQSLTPLSQPPNNG
jgi:hypothetical protein